MRRLAAGAWLLAAAGMAQTPPGGAKTVEEVLRLSPAGPFHLGRIEVQVTAEAPQLPGAYMIGGAEIAAHRRTIVTGVLSLAPGVTVSRVGARNEGVVYIRGFDMRQTPVYFDGIPVSVPYDGYADLDRFLAHDIGEVHVARGFSSTLYGPNTLGGAVNLVSRQPSEKLHGEVEAGYESGRAPGVLASLGARMRKWYLQTSGGWLQREFFPLPGGFRTSPVQPTHQRVNSDRRDARGHFKVGVTPKAGDEYAFGYLRQDARKGQPPYAGADPSVRPRYWRWPHWGKDSLYHIASKSLGRDAYLRVRAYYDSYGNRLESFDDASYTTRLRPTSFVSLYEDYRYGARAELGSRAGARQSLKGSVSWQADAHQEHNLGEPERRFRARTVSAGLEDTVRLGGRTQLLAGLSADRLHVLQAQNFQGGVVSPFPTGGLWAVNPQAGLLHALSPAGRLRFSFASKTRLPTLKDRYSYRMGRSVPNPELREERAGHWEAGYTRSIGSGTLLDAAAFYSAVRGLMQEFYVRPQVYQLRNLGKAAHAGFELSARTDRLRPVMLHVYYAYLHRKNVSAPGTPLIQTPRHSASAQASASLWRKLFLAGDVRFEKGRWDLTESGRYLKLGGFAVVNAGVAAPLGRRLELRVGARNLTDRHYYLDEGFPEEGRSLYADLRYRF